MVVIEWGRGGTRLAVWEPLRNLMVELVLPHSLARPMQDPLRISDLPDDCAAFRSQLDDLTAEQADAVSAARADAHAAVCAACRHALAAARAYRRAMRRVGETARAPSNLRTRAQEVLREVRGSRQN